MTRGIPPFTTRHWPMVGAGAFRGDGARAGGGTARTGGTAAAGQSYYSQACDGPTPPLSLTAELSRPFSFKAPSSPLPSGPQPSSPSPSLAIRSSELPLPSPRVHSSELCPPLAFTGQAGGEGAERTRQALRAARRRARGQGGGRGGRACPGGGAQRCHRGRGRGSAHGSTEDSVPLRWPSTPSSDSPLRTRRTAPSNHPLNYPLNDLQDFVNRLND